MATLLEIFSQQQFEGAFAKIIEGAVGFAWRAVWAVLAYMAGRWLLHRVSNLCMKLMIHRNVDISLRMFLASLLNIGSTIMLIIIVIGILGFDTASLVALFASAGVAIGMALSGTLQNFAGGVMILLFKPFRVGQVIEAQGYVGTVKEIQIFNTILNTFDNQLIYIPNGALSTSSLKNISAESTRRIDWVVGVTYGEDIDKVRTVLQRLVDENPLILREPTPMIVVSKLNESSVDITTRVWVKSEDYWGVFFKGNEEIYKEFACEGITIPFRQLDVNIKTEAKA